MNEMIPKYHLVQTGKRSWKLCHVELHEHTKDLHTLISRPFGQTYYGLSYALAALRNMREANYLDEQPENGAKP